MACRYFTCAGANCNVAESCSTIAAWASLHQLHAGLIPVWLGLAGNKDMMPPALKGRLVALAITLASRSQVEMED